MTARIAAELWQVGCMFCCGLAVMLLFAGRDALVYRCRRHRRAAAVVYLCGWLCAGFLFSEFLYRSAHGVPSVHGLVAMAGGILLWKKGICGKIPLERVRIAALWAEAPPRPHRKKRNEKEKKRENSGI